MNQTYKTPNESALQMGKKIRSPATEGAETEGQNPIEPPTSGAAVFVDMHLNVDLEG